jgi:hypothetical protein
MKHSSKDIKDAVEATIQDLLPGITKLVMERLNEGGSSKEVFFCFTLFFYFYFCVESGSGISPEGESSIST